MVASQNIQADLRGDNETSEKKNGDFPNNNI